MVLIRIVHELSIDISNKAIKIKINNIKNPPDNRSIDDFYIETQALVD